MSDTNTDYGYGEVDAVAKETSSNNRYMKLDDGKLYKLRIVSRPRYAMRHFLEDTRKYAAHDPAMQTIKTPAGGTQEITACELCKRGVKKDAQWGWIIIDRADGLVKIWKATNKPALMIRDLANLIGRDKQPVWGDPTTYDLKVKRSLDKSGFPKWEIDPDADGNVNPLTDAEKALVKEANYDLEKDMANSKNSEHVGNYGEAKPSMETLPESEVNPDDIPDNLGEEGKAPAGTSEDDLPF